MLFTTARRRRAEPPPHSSGVVAHLALAQRVGRDPDDAVGLAHLRRVAGVPGLPIRTGITLGGWLGGALQWHFAAMWLLFFNGLFYLAMNLATGRFVRKFLPRVAARDPARLHCRADRPALARRPAPLQRGAEVRVPVR